MASLDPTQIKLMEEQVILVDEEDRPVGYGSKKETHLVENIRKGMLHRAFSVFLFDPQGRLLLQQRADEKITFPGYWTNTCCSHPIAHVDRSTCEDPSVEPPNEEEGELGVRRAAQRKLWHELGIRSQYVPLEAFHYVTRLHYVSTDGSDDGIWGEHEVDYILLLRADPILQPSPNEVKDVRYFTKEELRAFIDGATESGIRLTPWFKLIADHFLFSWWDRFLAGDLHSLNDRDKIHHL